jgi:hypothetical protein
MARQRATGPRDPPRSPIKLSQGGFVIMTPRSAARVAPADWIRGSADVKLLYSAGRAWASLDLTLG